MGFRRRDDLDVAESEPSLCRLGILYGEPYGGHELDQPNDFDADLCHSRRDARGLVLLQPVLAGSRSVSRLSGHVDRDSNFLAVEFR
jgi:hypothetical protein